MIHKCDLDQDMRHKLPKHHTMGPFLGNVSITNEFSFVFLSLLVDDDLLSCHAMGQDLNAINEIFAPKLFGIQICEKNVSFMPKL